MANHSQLVKKAAQANSKTLIKNHYVHSYIGNFQVVLDKEGLQDNFTQVNTLKEILQTFVILKKMDLEHLASRLGYDNSDIFLNDLNSGLKKTNRSSTNKVIKELVKEKLDKFFNQDKWGNIIYKEFNNYLNKVLNNPQEVFFADGKQQYLINRAKQYKNSGKNKIFSKNAITEMRRGFISDLQNSNPELANTLQLVLFSSNDSDKYFASLIGIKKFQNIKDGKIPAKSKLKDVCLKNLGLDEGKGVEQVKSRVLGLFQEQAAFDNFINFFSSSKFKDKDITISLTGSKKKATGLGTAKRDITFYIPDDDIVESFGISVKSMVKKKYATSGFLKDMDAIIFKAQDLTLSQLEQSVRESKNKTLEDVIDKIYYIILNSQFFYSAGSKNEGSFKDVEKYSKMNKGEAVQKYLNTYFSALASFWLGQSAMEEGVIDSFNKDELMDVGLVYEPSSNTLIPVYKMLEAIVDNFEKENRAGNIKVNYTGTRTSQQAKELYHFKINSITKDYKGKIKYPAELINIGSTFGSNYSKDIKLKVVATFLKDLIK